MKRIQPPVIVFDYANIKPHTFLTKKVFEHITKVQCAGNYQYNNNGFIYRELNNISVLSKLHIEKLVSMVCESIFETHGAGIRIIRSDTGRYSVVCTKNTDIIFHKTKEYSNYLEPFIAAYNELIVTSESQF